MALEPSILEVEDIYIHLQNVHIWTDQCNVIYQLSNFSIKCCEGVKYCIFPIFCRIFGSLFLFSHFHRASQACQSQNRSFPLSFSHQILLENSDFLQFLRKNRLYKLFCFKLLFLYFSISFIQQFPGITPSMLQPKYKFPMTHYSSMIIGKL